MKIIYEACMLIGRFVRRTAPRRAYVWNVFSVGTTGRSDDVARLNSHCTNSLASTPDLNRICLI